MLASDACIVKEGTKALVLCFLLSTTYEMIMKPMCAGCVGLVNPKGARNS